MATAILRPNATVTAQWAVTGAATSHEALDDAVTQPTTPGLTDYVDGSNASQFLELALDTVDLGGGAVTGATIWLYGFTNLQKQLTADLRTSSGSEGSGTIIAAAGGNAWHSLALTPELSQADLDDLRVRLQVTIGTGGARVHAVYVELTYTEAGLSLTPATEVDAAQSLSASKTIAVGAAAEADAAQPITAEKRIPISAAAETNTTQVLSFGKQPTFGPAVETDSATGLTVAKRVALDHVTESDTAQPLMLAGGPHERLLTPAVETDTALALSVTAGGGGAGIYQPDISKRMQVS